MRITQFKMLKEVEEVRPFVSIVQCLADTEKDALGFIPTGAFEDANIRQRLIVAVSPSEEKQVFAGYLLFSGVFPHAKVQQIGAAQEFRRLGVAAALIRALTSELERIGYISIRADVASDLSVAQAFYEKQGFQFLREKDGGAARNRKIRIYSKTLESDTLFTYALSSQQPGIEIKSLNTNGIPLYAFDLNVYFDLVRDRNHSQNARQLFSEALGHTYRLAVADEFVAELRRTSKNFHDDALLQLALQLPRLPKPDANALSSLADDIHDLIFVKSGHKDAGTKNAKSDALHVAHAALSKAAAFITRDGPILRARQDLLREFAVDIATIDEIIDLFPSDNLSVPNISLRGKGFTITALTSLAFVNYCKDVAINHSAYDEFCKSNSSDRTIHRVGINLGSQTVGVGALVVSKSVDPLARMIVHVRHEMLESESFADHLVDTLVRLASSRVASAIELIHLSGQSIVNRRAVESGFHRGAGATAFTKIAIGKPLTAANWDGAVQQIRRRTKLILPSDFNSLSLGIADVILPNFTKASIEVVMLEKLLSPTLIIWPGRDGVIVPITRQHADELLGTSDQSTLDFIENKDAVFLSLRGYVNTPRAAKVMRPGTPIVFYESKKSGNGRGAAVAVARIENSVVVSKTLLDPKSDSRLVIEDADQFSTTRDVLLTTFSNVMPFPRLVPFRQLKDLNAVSKANLVSAQALPNEQISAILTRAWATSNAS